MLITFFYCLFHIYHHHYCYSLIDFYLVKSSVVSLLEKEVNDDVDREIDYN